MIRLTALSPSCHLCLLYRLRKDRKDLNELATSWDCWEARFSPWQPSPLSSSTGLSPVLLISPLAFSLMKTENLCSSEAHSENPIMLHIHKVHKRANDIICTHIVWLNKLHHLLWKSTRVIWICIWICMNQVEFCFKHKVFLCEQTPLRSLASTYTWVKDRIIVKFFCLTSLSQYLY